MIRHLAASLGCPYFVVRHDFSDTRNGAAHFTEGGYVNITELRCAVANALKHSIECSRLHLNEAAVPSEYEY